MVDLVQAIVQAIGCIIVAFVGWVFIYVAVKLAAIAWFKTKVYYERNSRLIEESQTNTLT